MINTSNLSEIGFFELIRYSRTMKLCMKPFCTTCGSLEFRNLCRNKIGKDNLVSMVEAVTEDELVKHDYNEWIGLFRIILYDFSYMFQENCPLMAAHREGERQFIEKKDRKMQKEIERQASVLSRKESTTELYKIAQENRKEVRKNILSVFGDMDLNNKLLTIANDQTHLPHYYPLNLKGVSDNELKALPMGTLEIIILRFSSFKKREWQYFYSRVFKIYSQLAMSYPQII